MIVFAAKNSDVYDGLFGVAYVSQEMITYEFDRPYNANAAQHCCLHSVP
ncbi:MAG: hypothetical protein V7K32_04670 [Nostoc sp.]